LLQFVRAEQQAGRLRLSAPEPTPLGWWLRNLAHLVGVPLLLLLLLPVLVVYAPIFASQLRRHERRDPEITPTPEPVHVRALADLEGHDVTKQLSALGIAKPGVFRRTTLRFFLWLLDYGARHVYNRGHLTRV